jgi:hypothetical protein
LIGEGKKSHTDILFVGSDHHKLIGIDGHKPKTRSNSNTWMDGKSNAATDLKKMYEYVRNMDRNMLTTAAAHW